MHWMNVARKTMSIEQQNKLRMCTHDGVFISFLLLIPKAKTDC